MFGACRASAPTRLSGRVGLAGVSLTGKAFVGVQPLNFASAGQADKQRTPKHQRLPSKGQNAKEPRSLLVGNIETESIQRGDFQVKFSRPCISIQYSNTTNSAARCAKNAKPPSQTYKLRPKDSRWHKINQDATALMYGREVISHRSALPHRSRGLSPVLATAVALALTLYRDFPSNPFLVPLRR